MKLPVFKIIEETLQLLEQNNAKYQMVEASIVSKIQEVLAINKDCILGFQSRIKSKESLREKIVRNRYYVHYDNAQSIIDSLSDVIGCRIECRFLQDEKILVDQLYKTFTQKHGDFYSREEDDTIFLNLADQQPQKQKNGLSIYRFDGYYVLGKERIRFELQIKSLVNSFWGSIEHRLVYKNNNYLETDAFMSDILLSIHASLNVLDKQLSIVQDHMNNLTKQDIETSERNIERLIAKSINDVFSNKMKETIGFSLSIKHTSRVLAHYIFMKNILYAPNSEDSLATLLRILRKIHIMKVDFEQPIHFETEFIPQNKFQEIFGTFLLQQINVDYDWYIFFKMLLTLEQSGNMVNIINFLNILERTIVEEYWLKTTFINFEKEKAKIVQEELLGILATSLIRNDSIHIVEEEHTNTMNQIFRQFVAVIENECPTIEDFMRNKEMYQNDWNGIVFQIFGNKH